MPLRNKHHPIDPVWHVQLALAIIIGLQLLLIPPTVDVLHVGIPLLELILLLGVRAITPKEATFTSKIRRTVTVSIIAAIAFANGAVLWQLLHSIIFTHSFTAGSLLMAGAFVYITTLSTFALLYWEMDGGGPGERRKDELENHDFLFPQQHLIKTSHPWHATFIDYVYLSLTNMTNFTSSDSIPLSRRAKMLMSVQSIISVVTVIMVIARAISTL